MPFNNIGITEVVIVLVIVLIIFGPKRLPEMGRSLGRGLREFKNSLTRDHRPEDDRPALEESEPVSEPSEPEPVKSATPDN